MLEPLQFLPWLLTAVLAALWLFTERRRGRASRERDDSARALASASLRLTCISQAVESASDAIGIGDMESNSLYHNRAHLELFGYTVEELNAVEEPAALFADKTVAAEIHQSIRAGRSWHGETEIQTRAGRIVPAFVRADIIRDEQGHPIGIFGVFTDITERRTAERVRAEERERAARAERLESLGMLAGGVAHDFGNILTVVVCNAAGIRARKELSPAMDQRLAEIEVAAQRASDLSRNLLAFARGAEPKKQRIALGPLIEVAVRGAVQHGPVELILELAPDLAAVEADPVQIDQVVSNLAVNAVQAMPGGGKLRVVARNSDGWQGSAASSPISGTVVCITITDTGGGIPAEVLPRIWEPFFTTKARGTGLGLATVYAMVKKHAGTIDVQSEAGRGTTFTVVLPAAGPENKIRPGLIG